MWKLLVVAVLVGLPALGVVNYRRNAPLDDELQSRVYASMSDQDLNALVEAYQGEVDRLASRVAERPQAEDELDGFAASDLAGRVEGFESFQQYNRQWRRSRAQLFEQEAALAELLREKSIRDQGLHRPLNRIKRRVLTF
ncbi:MAG: hypothetical protein V3V67_09845 [Myxococcota bacterium]